MSERLEALRVDEARLREDFAALAAIGPTPEGGVDRPALGPAHSAARRWFLERAGQAGLETHVDAAGNHSAVLRCGPRGAPTLLLGSHLDSVPQGGRFDGALGVLAALEVLRTVRASGLSLPVHLEAIDFTDEEGYWVGLLGSRALAGRLTPDLLTNPRGGREQFLRALAAAGLDEGALASARRDPAGLAGYLELHIEQGRRLVEQGVSIGIVSAIVGIRSLRVHFLGRADHAGTISMEERRDAGLGACALALAARTLVMRDFPGSVVNVGDMRFEPGAYNVIPGRVSVALEFRAFRAAELDRLEATLRQQAAATAGQFGLGLEVESLPGEEPVELPAQVQEVLARACRGLGLLYAVLPSWAGHDGQAMVWACPGGMVFVPSVDGASHTAREFSHWEDCVNGANVLLRAALLWAQECAAGPVGQKGPAVVQ